MMRTAGCFALALAAWTGATWAADQTVTVALLQMRADGAHQQANLEKADRMCREAAEKGADIALMPEMWNIGYTRFDPDEPGAREAFYTQAVATADPWVQHFAELARALDMAIAATYLQAYDPLPRNAVTLFDRAGREVFTYAKVHTSDFKSMEASMTPGHDFYVGTLDTKAGPVEVGAMICFDREQPESARILMLKGAELIVTPNACGLDSLRLDQFKIRAWENVCHVAMANYAQPDQNGHSVAYSCRGQCVAEARGREDVYLAEFDVRELRERRRTCIWGNAYRRPHRYGLITAQDKAPIWRRIDGNGKPWRAEER